VQKTKNPRTFWVRGPKSGNFFSDSDGRRTRANKEPEDDESPYDDDRTRTAVRGGQIRVEGGRDHLGAHTLLLEPVSVKFVC